jgi:hypothetical protein
MLGSFCLINNKDVDVECPQIMRCIICYNNPIFFATLKFEQINGITILKKHVNANHFIITKMFEEEVNISLKGEVDNQPTKKIKSI